jgi:sigma-B regulation protein RsbU (phosphoserine phosphatase)
MLTAFSLWDIPYGYMTVTNTLVTLFLFGLVFSFLFRKYDLATSIIANVVMLTLNAAIPLFSSSGPEFVVSRWLLLALMAVPLAVAVGGYVKRERFGFTPETMPAHIQRISERVRMAKELEIARRVQMSLLPKVNPIVQGYDIAGRCIPALEVGGDYYDYVNLGGKKLGIAIGDVSGKGVPAAIYMTLTKGILQSHAEDNVSPKHVLSKVNSLMYRTIERNSFVSMFYAILDVEKRTIRFSRAGQCPVIVAQRSGGKGSFLTPRGIALGLEMGKVFDAVLEEEEMKMLPGDVLVFYTDGFTEAMNTQKEEYGESRLVETIARHRDKSAEGIIHGVCGEVEDFIGGTPQHDDMTIVVVKVNSP